MSDSSSHRLAFFTDASIEADRLYLVSVEGREQLSALFELDLLVHTLENLPLTDDEMDALLINPCGVSIGGGATDRLIHGRLSELERVYDQSLQRDTYRLKMVPAIWPATRFRRSRVFQDLSVDAIVEAVLGEHLANAEFDINVSKTYPVREYVVQYHEDDWSFINRLMEHHGLFHWFTHGDDAAVLHVADSNLSTTELLPETAYRYETRTGGVSAGHTVRVANRRRRRGTQAVELRDYNWRTPSLDVSGSATSDDTTGVGVHYHYGDHVKDATEAGELATVRAEELASMLDVHDCVADITELSAGHRFDLVNYPEGGATTTLLVVSTTFSQRVSEQNHLTAMPLEMRFKAIPVETPFRPARTTPIPTIKGFVHAQIDGAVDGSPAPINSSGHYKVLLPWDLVGEAGGSASRWVRMAQPHAGPGYGMHLPLHCGAEVLLAHVDGDVDRPIIIGSVPNEEHTSPVNENNATQSIIKTRGSIVIRMDDDV